METGERSTPNLMAFCMNSVTPEVLGRDWASKESVTDVSEISPSARLPDIRCSESRMPFPGSSAPPTRLADPGRFV